jgi:polar amino acid transport system substrate-binding protein
MLRGLRCHPYQQRVNDRTTGGLASLFQLLRALVALVAVLTAPRVCVLAAEWHPSTPLNVAVYDLPPYGAVDSDGTMSGVSVDLWRQVAEELQWEYKLTPVSHMESILSGLEQGQFDAAIGAITITPEREARVDFSYPAHRSGVAVALPKEAGPLAAVVSYWRVAADLGSLLVGMLALLVLLGTVIWLVERPGLTGKPAQEDSVATLRDGLYWAVVTTTTVGYGDKTPKTHLGRFVAVVWMLGSVVLVSMFSANMISRLTAERVENGGILADSDLRGKKLAAVTQSSGAEYLDRLHLKYEKFDDLVEALSSLANGRSNAVVNSEGTLRYLVDRRFRENIRVPRILLSPAYMAIALPENSPLKRPIDRALIKITASPEWKAVEERYFGQ